MSALHYFFLALVVTVALSFSAYDTQYADAALCQSTHCYASLSESGSSIQGIRSELKTPDLFIKDDSSCKNNIAVAANWIKFKLFNGKRQWLETGVTTGGFDIFGSSNRKCITAEQAYYTYQYLFGTREIYREIEIPSRLSPSDDVRLEISKASSGNTWKITFENLDAGKTYNPLQQSFGSSATVESAQVGIEGTVNAWNPDLPSSSSVYSSIPASKFSSIQKRVGSGWTDLGGIQSQSSSANQGYKLLKCDSGKSIVAGTVTGIDCNPAVGTNVKPTTIDQTLNVTPNTPVTVTLSGTDSDKDYLHFKLVRPLPTGGTLSHTNTGQNIPNTTPTTAEITYTPSGTTQNDVLNYIVTDERTNHDEAGKITFTRSAATTSATNNAIFSENFEGTLSKWTLTSDDDDDWSVTTGTAPSSTSGNHVIQSKNCDRKCVMTSGTMDTSGKPYNLSFWRYVSASIDRGEGLRVEVTTDNGRTWSEVARWGQHDNTDTDNWESESIDVSGHINGNFKIKVVTHENRAGEDVGLDYVRVTAG